MMFVLPDFCYFLSVHKTCLMLLPLAVSLHVPMSVDDRADNGTRIRYHVHIYEVISYDSTTIWLYAYALFLP